MRERARHPSLVGPLILITIGVLLLLNQMGLLRWDALWSLWRYWPVILILLGIETLIGASQSRVLYLLGLLIAVAVLAGVIGYAVLRGGETPAERPIGDTETLSQGLQDAERGLVILTPLDDAAAALPAPSHGSDVHRTSLSRPAQSLAAVPVGAYSARHPRPLA